MANPRMTLLDLLNKAERGADPDFLRDGLKLLAQELMDAEVTQLVGAGMHERAESRLTYRNGYRKREWEWDSRVGTIEFLREAVAGLRHHLASARLGTTTERLSRRQLLTHPPSAPALVFRQVRSGCRAASPTRHTSPGIR
jgi:hypothetical protein